MTDHNRILLRDGGRAALSLILLSTVGGCTTTTHAPQAQISPNSCPAAGWSWVRWNDAYGLNVVGIVQALPGWTFSFSPTAALLNRGDGEMSAVRIVLLARRSSRSAPGQTSDQHVYGYRDIKAV